MKKYIGTKEVTAQPMTAKEAIDKGYKVNNHTGDGYEVEYQDGYKSWSPKDVFEGAYKVSETHLDRLKIEETSLIDKINALNVFIYSDESSELNKTTLAILAVQREIMLSYLRLLTSRSKSMETNVIPNIYFNFGTAIELLEIGCILRRSSWDGNNLFVIKQIPAHIESDIVPKMQSLPQAAKNKILEGKGFIDYTSQCLIYNSETGRADSWAPSMSDVFAEDWELIL